MLTAVVLTYNEALHIERCLKSLLHVASRIVVVDSGSNDNTVELARQLGAEIYTNKWINYSTQLNWALENTEISTEWILRIDADEVVAPELERSILSALARPSPRISGFTVIRRIDFLDRPMLHGGMYPLKMLRIWRRGTGFCENRWMDEHIVVTGGEIGELKGDLVDRNLNGLGWWTAKHNSYSTREAIDLLLSTEQLPANYHLSRQARVKRFAKTKLYSKLPMTARAFLYFCYRYIALAGFLDGWQGFVFTVLQGFWYRFLVDAKVMEVRHLMRRDSLGVREAIAVLHGIRFE